MNFIGKDIRKAELENSDIENSTENRWNITFTEEAALYETPVMFLYIKSAINKTEQESYSVYAAGWLAPDG